MAILDRGERRIVVRVVFDGPALSGKTTNLEKIRGLFTGKRLGELVSPETAAGRTLFFDWMHLDGGLVGGYALRCQLVTVPGQVALGHRRRRILRGADVVVFVCESSIQGASSARPLLRSLRDALAEEGRASALIVVQANKQDLPFSVLPDELVHLLGLPPGTPAVAASAQSGSGVRDTLVLAIRAAADLAQRQLLDAALQTVERAESASDLHRRLLEADAEQLLSMQPKGSRSTALREDSAPNGDAGPGDPRPTVAVPPVPTRRESAPPVTKHDAPTGAGLIFPGPNVESVWPTTTGRASLQELGAAVPLRTSPEAREPIVFRAGSWRLVTRSDWRYESSDDGRSAMVQRVRSRVALGALRPAGEVVALQKEGDSYRLWSLAPRLRTLDEWTSRAIEREDEELLSTALGGYALGLVGALRAGLGAEGRGVLALENFGLAEGRVSYLDELASPASDSSGVALAVLAPGELAERFPGALADYVAVVDEALAAHEKLAAVLRASLSVCRPSCASGYFLRERWLQALAEEGG